MKWYKHLTGSLNNSFVFELVYNFGGDGYMVFFGVLELIADEFDVKTPGKVRLLLRKVTKNLQLSRQKTVKILKYIDQKAKENSEKDVGFFVEFEKHHVVIKCNRLATLCDEYTAKLLKNLSGVTPECVGSVSGVTPVQEGEGELEGEREYLKEPSKKRIPFKKIVGLYHEILYPELHKAPPLSETIKTTIRARWNELKEHQSLEWWRWYFTGVSKCSFLMGKNNRNWKATFAWLIGPKNMTKVLAGDYVDNGADDFWDRFNAGEIS